MTYRTVSNIPRIQQLYDKCRRNKCGHRMAYMLAFQSPPRALTDREFLEGRGTLADQFEGQEHMLDSLVGAAKKHGHKPGVNDVYDSSLAAFHGDPEAFVPPTGGRGHVKRVCEKRGWASEGAVNVKGREPEADPLDSAPRLAPDLVKEEVNARIKKNPDLARADRNNLEQEVISQHGA